MSLSIMSENCEKTAWDYRLFFIILVLNTVFLVQRYENSVSLATVFFSNFAVCDGEVTPSRQKKE